VAKGGLESLPQHILTIMVAQFESQSGKLLPIEAFGRSGRQGQDGWCQTICDANSTCSLGGLDANSPPFDGRGQGRVTKRSKNFNPLPQPLPPVEGSFPSVSAHFLIRNLGNSPGRPCQNRERMVGTATFSRAISCLFSEPRLMDFGEQ